MHHIILGGETDFDGWRKAARKLALNHVRPDDVTWSVRGDDAGPMPADDTLPQTPQGLFNIQGAFNNIRGSFNVPAKFVALADAAILHRDDARFALLYRLLWRLLGDHDLLEATSDPDVTRITAMAGAVQQEAHRMQAAIRFHEVGRERDARYIAWFAPEHHIVALAAPFFARRYADMPWSILTPDLCAHWDGLAVCFTPGVPAAEAPTGDRLEDLWRHYQAGRFGPSRPTATTVPGGMPRKDWRNLPEGSMIKPLIEDAARMTGAIIADEAGTGLKPMRRTPEGDITALREEAASCRACPLWKNATRTVFGEGPAHAPIMLVGEQPGDKEDLAGHPFVGPAGLMLDRALEAAGIDRTRVYVTNAVKHFKFVPRGKIRLHQKPSTPEIKACRQWYERELAAIRPALVVALGATAAHCVLGRITPVNKNRGRLIDLDEAVQALVTVHPSYLLRVPDEAARALEYQRFVDDLEIAAKALRKSAHAA